MFDPARISRLSRWRLRNRLTISIWQSQTSQAVGVFLLLLLQIKSSLTRKPDKISFGRITKNLTTVKTQTKWERTKEIYRCYFREKKNKWSIINACALQIITFQELRILTKPTVNVPLQATNFGQGKEKNFSNALPLVITHFWIFAFGLISLAPMRSRIHLGPSSSLCCILTRRLQGSKSL